MKLSAELQVDLGAFHLDVAFELTGHAALVGPNGAGKTTILDALAGLRRPGEGRIELDGAVLFGPGVDLPAARRRIGYVFQDGALFPHLTVARNVGYANGSAADALLARFGLNEHRDKLPAALSAGERQRVAVARALAAEPVWLLLDEPFAALDPAARPAFREEVFAALGERGVPALLVTHQPEEALAVAGQVLVLESGRLAEQGDAAELLARPTSRFGAALAGLNYFLGQVEQSTGGMLEVRVGEARVTVPGERRVGETVAFVVAPSDIILTREAPATSARNHFVGRVATVTPDPPGQRVTLTGPLPLSVWVTPASVTELELTPGRSITALFKASGARLC